MAQTALYLANEKGIKIHNLILLGSTIDPNSELGLALQNNPNIGSVTWLTIPGDNVNDGITSLPSLITMGDNHPHFMFALWKDAHEKRMELFRIMKLGGIK